LDTKWKKWTAHKVVKAVSFILIIGLSFLILNRVLSIAETDSLPNTGFEVVFEDLSGDQFFFDRNMRDAYFNATRILFYGSEERILAGELIRWVGDEYNSRLIAGGALDRRHTTFAWLDNVPFFNLRELQLGFISEIELEGGRSINAQEIQIYEQDAIEWQMESFRSAQEFFNNADGIIYFIQASPTTAGTRTVPEPVTNIDDLGATAVADYIRSQPVYIIEYGGLGPDMSHVFNNMHRHNYLTQTQALHIQESIFIAFPEPVVTAHNALFIWAQQVIIRDIIIISVAGIMAIFLLIILVFGAGRRYGQPKDVYFVLPGKVFLDLSLAVVVLLTALSFELLDELSRPLLREINSNTILLMNVMFAVICVLLLTPVLFWILSLAKSLKAGKFWKRILILALPVWIFKTVIRFARSLWVGAALMVKVSIIAIVIFLALIFVVWVSLFDTVVGLVIIAPGITVASAILLLRYAKRIKTLEQGATVVCGGKYNETIAIGGGELGSIADSINNIGEGIHNAVEQRMKSERLKTELITNVSHDIRTPLTSIITYTDLLKHEGLDCEKAPEYLEVLIQKSQRLKTLTDELFEAAKASSGNIDITITDLDMVSLVSQVMGEMDSAIISSGLDIRFNHPEHLHVKGDGRLMWRVMENLLSNVFKYALPGSRVYVDISPEQSPYSCISIKNISSQELNINPSELTERFKRGDESRSEGGSGLGLSIVQSFVEAQNGKFEITIDGDLFKATVWLPVG